MPWKPRTEAEERAGATFDEALDARHAGELLLAKGRCLRALELLGDDKNILFAAIHGELGYLHRLLEDPATACDHFRHALRRSPRAELGSLGLFHSLVNQGLWEPALSEAVRFLRLSDSAEYREMFCEGFGDTLPVAVRYLVAEARDLLRRYERRVGQT